MRRRLSGGDQVPVTSDRPDEHPQPISEASDVRVTDGDGHGNVVPMSRFSQDNHHLGCVWMKEDTGTCLVTESERGR